MKLLLDMLSIELNKKNWDKIYLNKTFKWLTHTEVIPIFLMKTSLRINTHDRSTRIVNGMNNNVNYAFSACFSRMFIDKINYFNLGNPSKVWEFPTMQKPIRVPHLWPLPACKGPGPPR